jgi:protein-tyrosine phosphatase
VTVHLLSRRPEGSDASDLWVDWPDFRGPRSTPQAVTTLREVLERSASELVLLQCHGGVGRTGTAIAALAVLDGLDEDPVRWVRSVYHPRAVETVLQRRWLRSIR